MCFTDNSGVTACRTVAEISNIISSPNGGRWKVASKNEPSEIDLDYAEVDYAEQLVTKVNKTLVEHHFQ